MLADVLEVLGDVLVAVGEARQGPRRVHGRIRLISGEAGDLEVGEEIGGDARVDHRSIILGGVELTGVAVGPHPLRVSYLDEIAERARVLRIEFDGGAAEWTVPESTNLRKLRKRIGASF